jgi:hypothetical protein
MSISNKIQCLKRMIETDSHHEMIEWLKDYKFITENSVVSNSKSSLALSEVLFLALSNAVKEEKIHLLDYEWTLLPREYIKITIISEREQKEFTYNL